MNLCNLPRFFLVLLLCISLHSLKAQKSYAVFNHVAIDVRNLDKSVAFYTSLLHFQHIPSPWPKRRISWFNIGGHTQLHIIEADVNEKIIVPENLHFCFSIRSMDAFIARLKSGHIDYDDGNGNKSAINVRPDGIKQIYLRDPDGYMIEINDQVF